MMRASNHSLQDPSALDRADQQLNDIPETTSAPIDSPPPQPVELERFLTARELAELLNVSENYIYDLAAKGILPSYKIRGNRRFRWSEIEQWLDQLRTTTYDPGIGIRSEA
jgi:excisionase family DNA binding protein